MKILQTERLELCQLSADRDAPFIFELVNEEAFLRYIGDKGVRNLGDARSYIETGPLASYQAHGFGLYLVRLHDGTPVGTCGLLKRDSLDDVDVGFAFLARFRRQGYAYEAASATLAYGRETLGIERIVALTDPDNEASRRLLEKLGLRFDRMIQFPDAEGDSRLFVPA